MYIKRRNNFLNLLVILLLLGCSANREKNNYVSSWNAKTDDVPIIFYNKGNNLQQIIDGAQPYSTIIFNPSHQLLISTPIVLHKPLTLKGLNARLPDELGDQSIIVVKSENVTITDFELTGNASTVPQSERAALITVYTGDFRIERGKLKNSSKDGIEVDSRDFPNPVDGGVIRNIVGKGCIRDVISLGGPAGNKTHIKNIFVENIRGYDSNLRGTVEVSDGAENITVRKIYAENCIYAIDVQDHNKSEINKNILIDDVYAIRCQHAIRTANHENGHSFLSIENITAVACEKSLYVKNTNHVKIQNLNVLDYNGEEEAAIHISNCDALTMNNIGFEKCASGKEALLIENCNNVTVDDIKITNSPNFYCGLVYRLTENNLFENLMISNISVLGGRNTGIILDKTNSSATLNNYIITNNLASFKDNINGNNKIVKNNSPRHFN